MDDIFTIILLLLHWRSLICLMVSGSVAFFLVMLFPWLTVTQGIVLAALGLIPAVLWEMQDHPEYKSTTPQSSNLTSRFDNTFAVMIGCAWGGFSGTSIEAFFAGAIIFVAIALSGFWYAYHVERWMTKAQLVRYIVLAALAYPIGAILSYHFVFKNMMVNMGGV
jgi:hypothetical protein